MRYEGMEYLGRSQELSRILKLGDEVTHDGETANLLALNGKYAIMRNTGGVLVNSYGVTGKFNQMTFSKEELEALLEYVKKR